MLEKITSTTQFLFSKSGGFIPDITIVIGSGLGLIEYSIDVHFRIPYSQIPDFESSTVAGHKGEVLFGMLEGKKVVVLSGRLHYYEGHEPSRLGFAIRVCHSLGAKTAILSNAAGAINSSYNVGDIMIIKDHINMLPNPLRGININQLGERFPSMNNAYSERLREIAKNSGVECREGVYIAVSGPSYETPAEINFFRVIGADAVGMSTVPEVIVARHAGMEVFALSVITNSTGDNSDISHNDVIEQGKIASEKVVKMIKFLINKI